MKYIVVAPSDRMVRQELEQSCGAACIRQLLRDAGVEKDEATLRELAFYSEVWGIIYSEIRDVLNALHPDARYVGGRAHPPDLVALASSGTFIANVRTPDKHWVIVDRVEEDRVCIRDPAGVGADPRGAAGEVERGMFEDCWKATHYGTVWRKGNPS